MRIAFISDIHGNFTALQAVLSDIESQKVDRLICLGDTVTMGPQPMEVLATLQKLDCTFIKGNHDSAVLNPQEAGKYEIAPHLIPDLVWCRDQLTPSHLEFLSSFHPHYELSFPNDGATLLCFLEQYFIGQNASIFIGGHSHIQMHRRLGSRLILNSGSVGNAFEYAFSPGLVPSLLPWAEYAILSQSGDSLDVDLRRVYYDTGALLEVVKKSSLPGSAWWLRQFQDN